MPLDRHIQMLIYNMFYDWMILFSVLKKNYSLLMNKVINYFSECLKFECLKSIGGEGLK